ncbi:PLP-dependent aminotransferase family protein [Pararhodobacter aggregans]|uniref:GntR family transcriptional regulator n=1 Tax=Pararhodobacter aggregans TaxID=404875 RepID=A0A2T7UMS6_9RHOB|nr:PLP-dependent aminotransferase family protein [Pararhodobacter aggregans]PTW99428.1 DNA-binding transcriptional MocR family regulator [Pararhodobacter aggregans]PVE45966.1 GntR family transcriptional regulator [Pararhodobacter aggregans]
MMDWVPQLEDTGKPRYLAIADAIAQGIQQGLLRIGDRLPPQRRLAAHLGLDFTTVSRAYAEAQARGLIAGHVGRGTFVAPRPATTEDPERRRAGDLSMNLPPEPTDPVLLGRMQAGLGMVSANLVDLLRYQSPIGAERDRIAAAGWLGQRGLTPAPERIAVTPGAHATMAAILSIVTSPGDRILCERLTYPGIRNIAARFGVTLIGLEMDAQGITPEALRAAIARHQPKALYLNPTLQNPTTLTIPAGRRQALAEVLNDTGLTLIEDDAYGFIPAKTPAPLAQLAPDLTWHIGGLAKCLGAGLRLAFTVAPSPRGAIRLSQAIRALSVMPSPLSTALTTQWIEDGTADAIRRFIRLESAARQAIAQETLEGFRFEAAENAFNIWLTLPEGVGRADVVVKMAGRSLGLIPSDAFTVDGPPQERLRVCLGGRIGREELRETLLLLHQALLPSEFMG